MKVASILILTSLLVLNAQGQNLILNGDFEELKRDSVINWESTAGTPDIINLNNLTKDFVWETNKKFFKGIKSRGFVGFAFDDKSGEVLGTKMSAPLSRDSVYNIRIKFLTGYSCTVGLEKITIGLANDRLIKSKVPKYYEINSADIYSDKEQIQGGQWSQLEVDYRAKGGERYLYIGNFNGANERYTQKGSEILVGGGERPKSCSYLIIDKIELVKDELKIKSELPFVTIEDIAFEFGKWELKPSHFAVLNDIIEILKSKSGRFIISGYTDNIGSSESNLILSKNRANAVKSYFVENGLAEDRFVVIGKGDSFPKNSNLTEEDRRKNRRVEIRME